MFLPSLQRRKGRNSQQKQAWSEDHACLGKNGGWEWRCRKWGSVCRRGGWFLGGPAHGPVRQDCTAGPRRPPYGSYGKGCVPWRSVPVWRVVLGHPPVDRPGKIVRRGQGARPTAPTGGGVSRGGLYRRGGRLWGNLPVDRPGRILRRGQGTRPTAPTGEVFLCRPAPRGICLPVTRNQRDKCLEFLCLLSL